VSGFGPPILNSSIKSWNWPCMSPHTVTGHFCAIVSGGWRRSGIVYVPRAVRSTRPAAPRGPIAHCCQNMPRSCVQAAVAYLFAEPLYVALGQLLAGHEALDPAVQRGDCGGLAGRGRRQLHGLRHLHVLHIGIHGCWGGGFEAGGVVGCCGVELQRRGVLPFELGQ
jgi:hypothetical protein